MNNPRLVWSISENH